MAARYLLLLLPALVYARIEVDIVASENEGHRAIHVSGTDVDLISDVERATFKLSDEGLKKAVQSYFGKRPSDTYLRSPTPWGDLYQSYGWTQVTRMLTPQRARILSVTSEPTIVLTQIFHNNSTKQTQFKAQINQEVQNTVSSFWEKGGELSVEKEIEYGIEVEVASVSGKTIMSYSSKWGEGSSKSETVKVGTESGVTISLEPNQKVIAELYATRGTMKIQIDYEASLSGTVAVNYDETYKSHNFWSLDVNAVMGAEGLPRSIHSSEVITLGYYSDSRVVIKDSENDSVLYSIPMEMY